MPVEWAIIDSFTSVNLNDYMNYATNMPQSTYAYCGGFVVSEVTIGNIRLRPFEERRDESRYGRCLFFDTDSFLDFGVCPFGEEPGVLSR